MRDDTGLIGYQRATVTRVPRGPYRQFHKALNSAEKPLNSRETGQESGVPENSSGGEKAPCDEASRNSAPDSLLQRCVTMW